MLLSAQAGSYTDPYRNVSVGNHSTQMSDIRKKLLTIGVLLLYVFHYWKRELTSSDAIQYQQKTCLHLLHIIWAQPSFRSIGKWQTGQRLIGASTAASNGILFINILLDLVTEIQLILQSWTWPVLISFHIPTLTLRLHVCPSSWPHHMSGRRAILTCTWRRSDDHTATRNTLSLNMRCNAVYRELIGDYFHCQRFVVVYRA